MLATETAMALQKQYFRAQWMLEQVNIQVLGGSDVTFNKADGNKTSGKQTQKQKQKNRGLYGRALMLHTAGPEATSLTAPGVYSTYGARFGIHAELGRPQYTALNYVTAKENYYAPGEVFDSLTEQEAAKDNNEDNAISSPTSVSALTKHIKENCPHLSQLPPIHQFPFLLRNLPEGKVRTDAVADCEIMASIPFSDETDNEEQQEDETDELQPETTLTADATDAAAEDESAELQPEEEKQAGSKGADLQGPTKRKRDNAEDTADNKQTKPKRKYRRRKKFFY